MKRELTAQPIKLSTLLEGIADGVIVLPEFQRSFDWSDGNIKSLLATILMDWPAGSLLLMDGKPDFSLRPLEGAPTSRGDIEYVVLDGQQRLTSLFHSFRGQGDKVWILDGMRFEGSFGSATVDDIEEAIRSVDRDEWRLAYPLERQGIEGLVPLMVLKSATDYFEWRDMVVAEVPASDRKLLRVRLTNIYKELLSRVHEYTFPAVVLQAKLEVEAIARIFERINRTGLRLTTFDLMVARTYTPSWNLRDEWDSAITESPVLGGYVDDGLPVLQVLSMLLEEDIRQPAVLSTDVDEVRDNFLGSCQALASAYEWLATVCGVRSPDWVPYNVMPIVVGSLAACRSLDEMSESLERWFWLSIVTQRYDVGSSTQAAADFVALRDGSEPTYPTRHEDAVPVAKAPLLEATRRRMGPFWRGFACAMGQGTVLDPLTGESLVDSSLGVLLPRTSIRPVFPQGGAIPGRSPAHVRVLASFLSGPSSTKRLAGRPAGWAEAKLDDEALKSQLLAPSADLEALLFDSSAFLEDRLERLMDFVTGKVGMTVLTL